MASDPMSVPCAALTSTSPASLFHTLGNTLVKDCVECDATFTQVTHLHRHMAKHTGKKPYLCCECGAAFVENCALKNHLQRHRRRAESSSAGGKKNQKQAPSKVSGGLQS